MMIWFNGLVEEAVQKALKEKKIFLVYVEGDDDDSKKMETTWNDEKENRIMTITSSENERSWESGVESVGNETGDHNYINPENVDCTGSETESAPTATKTEVEKDAASEPTDIKEIASQNDQSEATLQDRVARAESLIAEKRDKEKQDELKEEKRRRNEGHQLGLAKKNREDIESKKWIDEQAKAKADAKAARDAVRLKLEQDKAEKKARYQKEKEEERMKRDVRRRTIEAQKAPKPKEQRKTTRIQFRLSNGSALTREFPSDTRLVDVVTSISQDDMIGTSNITLATVYPRRQFSTNELDCTLLELNLVPSAALIVISQRSNEGTAGQNSLLDFIKFILSPLVAILLYIKALIFGQAQVSNTTNSTSNVAQKDEGVSQKSRSDDKKTRDSATGYKKEGNVYQFKQDDSDDDDEKKTWNGNSTQQM
eukprot:gene14189-5194_t